MDITNSSGNSFVVLVLSNNDAILKAMWSDGISKTFGFLELVIAVRRLGISGWSLLYALVLQYSSVLRYWGLCTANIKSSCCKTNQWKRFLVWKKKTNPCCPITCVIIGIEAPFDVGNLSLTRCNLQSQDVNVVLGPFGCLELTRCSLWFLQFATTVPIVSVGLFALVWPSFIEPH